VDFKKEEDHQMKEKLSIQPTFNGQKWTNVRRASEARSRSSREAIFKPRRESLHSSEEKWLLPSGQSRMPHPHYDAPSVSAVGRRTGESADPRKCGVNPGR
jgi:hypothetical protein